MKPFTSITATTVAAVASTLTATIGGSVSIAADTVVATARGPVVLGFGRYASEAILAGAPGAHEYPLPVAVQA